MRNLNRAIALGIGAAVAVTCGARFLYAQTAASPTGYVLQADAGERIFGTSFIKVSPRSGAPNVAVVIGPTDPNRRSGVHVHDLADQIVLVTHGSGFAVLDGKRTPLATGDTVFIPRGVWHDVGAGTEGMQTAEIFVPGGVEEEMREVDRATDSGTRPITLDQLNAIAGRHGTRHQELEQ